MIGVSRLLTPIPSRSNNGKGNPEGCLHQRALPTGVGAAQLEKVYYP